MSITRLTYALSQYARARCTDDAFQNAEGAKALHETCGVEQHYMGFSVRTKGYRLTQWVACNISTAEPLDGTLLPDPALKHTEFYVYTSAQDPSDPSSKGIWDDYDVGEEVNMAGGAGNATLVAAQAQLQALLEGQFLS
jgi:hypothetical protein